jgi:hypothetical protein
MDTPAAPGDNTAGPGELAAVDLAALRAFLDAATDDVVAHLAACSRQWTGSPAEQRIIGCLAARCT